MPLRRFFRRRMPAWIEEGIRPSRKDWPVVKNARGSGAFSAAA